MQGGRSPPPTSGRWWWDPTWWTSSAPRWAATITVRGEQFTVVGILDKTLTAPDTEVYLTLPDAQRLFMQDLPEVIRGQVDQSDLVTWFVVYPTPGTDPEALAAAINETVAGVMAMGPSAFQEQIASATGIFNAILYGIAIIALFVGGLSVVNTMTMAVNERTREIGVRKAIGASDGQIVGQFLAESGVIGLIGGVTGLFLGWLAATVADKLLEPRNLDLFLVSPRLAIGSVALRRAPGPGERTVSIAARRPAPSGPGAALRVRAGDDMPTNTQSTMLEAARRTRRAARPPSTVSRGRERAAARQPRRPVIRGIGINKRYVMGEDNYVDALQRRHHRDPRRARWWPSWAPRAPASPPCCTCSAAWTR